MTYDPERYPEESPPPPPAPRPSGRARQRIQQRRQERTTKSAREPARRRQPSQIAPPNRLRLPDFRLPQNQRYLLYTAAGLMFVLLVVNILGRIRNDAPERPPNALWIGVEWTYESHEDSAIAQFAADLRARRIGTVYAWLSWLQADATWRGQENFEKVRAFVQQFKQAYPESELLAWIGFPVDAGQGYRLDQTELHEQVAQLSQTAVNEYGFDGVFLNIEPVWNGDENFLAIVRRVRSALGDGALLAAAIPPDWSPLNADVPVPPLIVPGTVWDETYKQSAALLLDQMAIMAYNSGLASSGDYTQWVAYQVRAFAEAIEGLGGGGLTELIIGMPTYDAELPGHDPLVENLESASAGIRLGIQQAGEAQVHVRGAGIYAGWTTDADEWSQWQRSWLQN